MRGVAILIVSALCLLLHANAAAAAAGCDKPGLDRAVAAVHQARGDLLKLPIGDGTSTDETPAAQRAIAVMKTRLGDVVGAFLRCQAATADPKAVLAGLTGLAGAKGDDKDYRYGSGVSFSVRRAPNLLAVTADFTIICSGDTMLMVFATDGGWHEVLRLQSPSYKEVSGAYEFFEYGISPPDAAGRWFVVEKNIYPWCSSTWSGIHYAVLRPSGDPLKPHLLFEGKDSVWWGAEDEWLRVGQNDFTVHFHAESIDMGVHNRVWLRHFSVAGDRVTRIPPLAGSARDFAEEWIQSDWETMAPWTARPDLAALQAKLHKIEFFEYASVRRCRQGRTQIELAPTPLPPAKPDTQPYFLTVSGDKDFRLLNASRTSDPNCKGPNLFTTQ
jgi:hypothetical protein